jgi:hypothetical protein
MTTKSSKQQLFLDMFVGTLIYAAVLGFFNDYTDILATSSYSVTFGLAVVMQLLTYLTFRLKDLVAGWFKARPGKAAKLGLVFGVWFVMFASKFVFLAVIELLFSKDVIVSGFVGLMIVIITMTVVQKLADLVYKKLA